MNESQIFYPEIEIWRLMNERFEADGFLVLKLRRNDALALDRSIARNKWLDALATKRGLLSSCQYWAAVAWELIGVIYRYIFAPNAARAREFCLINKKTIASIDLVPCSDEPKCMLVRLNRIATSTSLPQLA